jgi:glycosyltransferase involved in cell wall biosynthesis
LLANSRFTQDCIQTAYGVQAPVCYYGVDYDSFYPIDTIHKEAFILSVGEMSPRKGFDFLVESLGRIPSNERPPLKLACNSVIPQEQAYIEGLAVQYGVDLQVLTNLDTDELRNLYNRASICAYSPVLEPFGLVPLEAMACETPVVGVRTRGAYRRA